MNADSYIGEMLGRFLLAAFIVSPSAHACTCINQSVSKAKARAEVVFKGTVSGYRDDGPRRYVIFDVQRVWKGDVGRNFEMPIIIETTACVGFASATMLALGNELIVYAYRLDSDADYITDICTRTSLTANNPDVRQLGRGRKPKP